MIYWLIDWLIVWRKAINHSTNLTSSILDQIDWIIDLMIIMINFYWFETNIGFLFVCLFVCLFPCRVIRPARGCIAHLETSQVFFRPTFLWVYRQRSLPHRSCCDTGPPFLLPHLDFCRIPYHQILNLTITISYTSWYFPTIRTILVDFYTILSHQNSTLYMDNTKFIVSKLS